MGAATDTLTLQKGTLIPVKRTTMQGPVALKLEFAGNKVTGSLNMNGQEKPISADTGGPLFPEAINVPQAFAALPLAEGYSTTFRNFDVQSQKTKLMQLKVSGAEKVTVGSSTYDTYKVEITSAEGGPDRETIWVSKADHKAVKLESVLVAVGGAVMTAELQ